MADTDVQTVPLDVTQDDCFEVLLEFYEEDGTTPKDVSGWTFESQIRDLYDSETVLATFSFSQFGYANYQVLMSLTSVQTGDLPIAPATSPGKKNLKKLSYDLKVVVETGCPYTVQQGTVYVNPSVTRP